MPNIVINVAGEVPGVPGVAREFIYSKIDPTPPLVTLTIDDNSGITEWLWELLDQPTGASAILSTPTLNTTTFTPTATIAGTYLIRCTFNGGPSNAYNAVAWSTKNYVLRIPAAGETTQFNLLKGWALATEKAFTTIDAFGDLPDPTLANVLLSGNSAGVTQINMNSQKIIGLGTATDGSDAVTKDYVDQKIQGLEWQDSVLDRGLNDPPLLPTDGDRYIIGATPTGAWVGHAEDIAEYLDPNWIFTTKKEGLACWVDDEDMAYVCNGTGWVKLASIVNHNDLGSLQGGTSGEYYHLTGAEHTDVVNKLGDLGYKQSLAPSVNLTKGDGSPWAVDQVDDASAVVGDLLYIAADSNWERADANAKATAIGFGIALEAGSGSKKILLPGGVFRNDSWSWTPGAVLYASAATVGGMTHTPPAGTGDYVVPVAIAKTATIIILCPALLIVKVA